MSGWPNVTLREACERGETVDPRKSPDIEFRYVDVSSVSNETFEIVQSTNLRGGDAPSRARRRIANGDIIFATVRPTLQRIAQVPQELDDQVCSTGFIVLRASPKLDARYLFYALFRPEFTASMEELQGGASYPAVTDKQVLAQTIPLPPLEEQKRIVEVLDQAFAALDRARTLAEANLADAKELFERTAQDLFGNNDGQSGKTIGDVCSIQSGAGFPKKEQGGTSGEYPFYKVSDMNLEGNEWTLNYANNYVDEAARRRLGAKIFPAGAIVFPKVGGAISTNKKRVVVRAGCVDNNVMGLVPNAEVVVPEYVHEWLWAFDIYEFSNKAALPSITQKTVNGWPLAAPEKNEQLRIVDRIRDLKDKISDLTNRHTDDLADIADLRQSILQKAFAGQLT